MRLFLLFSLFAYLFLLSSCKKYESADAAFFVTSNTISVSTTSKQGSASHKITDLFWYVNGKYQGTYPNGNIMPVVSNDKAVRINVFAGIKNNGISDTRLPYPFFDFLILDTLVETGKKIQKNFTFKYKEATVFAWMENFDSNNGGISLERDKGYDGVMTSALPEECFENKSQKVYLVPGSPTKARVFSSENFSLPTGTGNLYLELNYKCNTPFTIGLVGTDGMDVPAITINRQDNWNKTYIQLSVAAGSINTAKCKVYFEFFSATDNTTTQIFLDNIKLLYL